MNRWIITAIVTMLLAGLVGWQWSRERQVAACVSAGGLWNGAKSRCEPKPGPVILRRGIERS